MRAPSPARAWLRQQAALSRPATLPIIGMGLGQTAMGIVQAWCVASLAGPVLSGAAPTGVIWWAGLFVAAAAVRTALGVLLDARAFEAGAQARRRLRTGYLVAAFAAGPHRMGPTGAAVAAAIDQVEGLEGYFGRWLSTTTLAWAAPVLVAGTVLFIDPAAAALMAIGGAVVPFGMALAGVGAASASHKQFTAMARLQTRFLDRVRGIATIVLAGQADAEASRLRDAAGELSRRTMRVLRVAFLSSAVLDAAAVAVLALLALRAGVHWRAGTLEPVTAVFTLVLVSEFFAPLRAFAAAYQDRLHATSAAATLATAEAVEAAAPPLPVRTIAASGVTVAFEDVGYAWDAARGPVFEHLTFRVPFNETAVLVGPSGAGKSTVVELLLGFIRPDRGRITINGADLASITPAALSRMTAWIGQRPVLFAGSVRDNIRFGREDASDDEIARAAKQAGLGAVLAGLPDGMETPVGEGGYGLSGGQAQRVAIARAFLRNAPLLLLDEPTAHLDPATEADVLDSLKRLALGRTVILAAHSSAAVAFSGRRIVLGAADAVRGAA